jgi:hypothetical protein
MASRRRAVLFCAAAPAEPHQGGNTARRASHRAGFTTVARDGRSVDDATLDVLARRLFAYQCAANVPYQKFCQRRGRTPDTVQHWHDIPAVPIGAFKELTLSCIPPAQAAAVWMSSGTTNRERRSKHYLARLDIYNASMLPNFAAHVLPDAVRLPMLVLNPPRTMLPNSSLAHYLHLVLETFGTAGSDFFFTEQGLALDRFMQTSADGGQRLPVS